MNRHAGCIMRNIVKFCPVENLYCLVVYHCHSGCVLTPSLKVDDSAFSIGSVTAKGSLVDHFLVGEVLGDGCGLVSDTRCWWPNALPWLVRRRHICRA